MSSLTVSKVADEAAVSTDAVRYYERIGLLAEPVRSPSGYRLYDDDAVDRVRFIKRSQRLGLRLDEIGELLEIRDRGLCPCGHTRTLLERRVSQLDEEMATMGRLRSDIATMLDELPTPANDSWQCSPAHLQIGCARPTPRKEGRP
ncbi:MAG: heavy metal-responsive transcriptional regulator [Acidimicrobiales bacterium]